MGDETNTAALVVGGEEEGNAILTSTDKLKSIVCGQPASVTLKVVGWSAPSSTFTGRRKFQCYLANSDDYVTYRFKNLDVKPIYLTNTPAYQEPNITSSSREFIFHGHNSQALLLAGAEKEKCEDYMKQFPGIPPYWKNLAEVSPWEKFLAGRAVTLNNFEKFKLEVREYKNVVQKSGIYGVAGDSEFNKTMFFIECIASEEGPALTEFRKGYEFTYQEGRSHLIGSTLWIVIDILYVSAVPNSDPKAIVDESLFLFVEGSVSSRSTVRKSEIKKEESDEAPAKRSRKSIV